MIKARIDQVDVFFRAALGPAAHDVKGPFCGLRAGKDVGRAAKYSRTRRSNRKAWIKPPGQHIGFGAKGRMFGLRQGNPPRQASEMACTVPSVSLNGSYVLQRDAGELVNF